MSTAIIKCRCGSTHQMRERPAPCALCGTDTWDHHVICARCRGTESSRMLVEKVSW